MNDIRTLRKPIGIFALVFLTGVFSFQAQAAPVPFCGPGPHWVDVCSAGTASFPTYAILGVDITLDGVPDFNTSLAGPTTVSWSNPIDTPDPLDPGYLNALQTELVAMNLTGGGLLP